MDRSTLNASEVLSKLHAKFSGNFERAITTSTGDLERTEIKTRAIAECGSVLAKIAGLTPSQVELAGAVEEVFADLVTSVYLASIGFDRAGQMVLRRALELGIAIVYLWDLPHLYWGWKRCDHDLSFSEMLEHLGSANYRAFLENTAGLPSREVLIDASAAKAIYRMASNTVHGKVTTHKVLVADGFNHSPEQWAAHLDLTERISMILLDLWFKRFSGLGADVKTALPAYERTTVQYAAC